MKPASLYIHLPFCQAKCGYCDFNSYAGLESLYEDYGQALGRELEMAGPLRLRTAYVGGGTPTVLPPEILGRILEKVAPSLVAGAELTVEANPGTVDARKLVHLRAMGVTRLSLGIQSFSNQELRLLGRVHTSDEALESLRQARLAGFGNINLDLIYGLPGQSQDGWQSTLEQALAQRPEHLSLYALSVEAGTPLEASIALGMAPEPNPDLAAEMYEYAQSLLAMAGYQHYEISNWARGEDNYCQHNLVYWRNEPYLGIGAGAHSWAGGLRRANVAAPAEYVSRQLADRCPVGSEESIDPVLEMGETMMMGLRLVEEGVEYARFQDRFGADLRQLYWSELSELAGLGLVEIGDERVRLSGRGRLLGNQVFLHFLPE